MARVRRSLDKLIIGLNSRVSETSSCRERSFARLPVGGGSEPHDKRRMTGARVQVNCSAWLDRIRAPLDDFIPGILVAFDMLRHDVIDALGNAPGSFFVWQILAGMIALRLGFRHFIVSQDKESLGIRLFNRFNGIQDPKGGMLSLNGLVFLIKTGDESS